MNSIVCTHCKAANRVAYPVMVPYMEPRSGERRLLWACSYHDSVELWPVFTRQSHTQQEKTQ